MKKYQIFVFIKSPLFYFSKSSQNILQKVHFFIFLLFLKYIEKSWLILSLQQWKLLIATLETF
jgi:hypothetical protein